MTSAHTLPARKMTIREFLGFYETRPDGERWELIDGEPIMMTPPVIQHQAITLELSVRLLAVIDGLGLPLAVLPQIGIVLPDVEGFRPEPDVAVIDADFEAGQRHAPRFELVAEVVSPSDRRTQAKKLAYYRSHPDCHTIVFVQSRRIEVAIHSRMADGWSQAVMTDPDAEIVIGPWGPLCRVRDLYRRTPLLSRE